MLICVSVKFIAHCSTWQTHDGRGRLFYTKYHAWQRHRCNSNLYTMVKGNPVMTLCERKNVTKVEEHWTCHFNVRVLNYKYVLMGVNIHCPLFHLANPRRAGADSFTPNIILGKDKDATVIFTPWWRVIPRWQFVRERTSPK